jgi:uncharacterized membrane protein YfcA
MGAAITTLLSYATMAVGIYIASQKFYKIHYEYTKIFFIFVLLAATVISYFFLKYFDYLLLKIAIFVIITSFIFIFKIVDIKIIKRFF